MEDIEDCVVFFGDQQTSKIECLMDGVSGGTSHLPMGSPPKTRGPQLAPLRSEIDERAMSSLWSLSGPKALEARTP